MAAFIAILTMLFIGFSSLITFIAGWFAVIALISAPQKETLSLVGGALAVMGIYAGVISAYSGFLDKKSDHSNHAALSLACDLLLTATTLAIIGLVAQFINVNYLPQWWQPLKEYKGLFPDGSIDDFSSMWNGAPWWYRGFKLLIAVPGILTSTSGFLSFAGIVVVLWILLKRLWDTFLADL